MTQNNFIVDLIASLQEGRSRKQIQAMAKRFVDIKVPMTGTLDKARTKSQIERDVASLKITNTVNLQGKVNKNNVTTSAQQVAQQAQNIANKRPIRYNAEIRKDKLINDIKILGQQYSKLHKDANMSAKYNTLLDNAKLATSGKGIRNLRAQLSAFRSELKANNLATLSFGDALKKTFKRAAQLLSGTGMVMLATRQIRQAWTEALNLDKAYTNLIKVQNELTRSDYPNYLERCNKKAKELATTQQALIESTTEFSKVGYDLNTSDALAGKATLLSNVGDMSAEDSSKAIISGIQAYSEVDGYTDVVNKADALISKYNEVGNKFSVTTAEIAQGVQSVGSVMADANTSVDQFIALLAATNRQYQDANSASLAIRTATLRIRGAKAELELMGEETEGVYTSTAKLADKIKGLTDIDGLGGKEGISILDSEGEFRNIYDILLDISKVYKDMNSLDQSVLLELIAGKHRASAISALLNNGEEIEKVYATSIASAGSAQKEYDKFLRSSEASLNTFKASLIEAYQSVFNGSTTKAILDSGSAVLNLVNSLGIIEKSLKGLLVIGAVKGITKLSIAFRASALSASNFGTSLKTVSTLTTLTKGTTEYANAMNLLKVSTVGLSEAQLRQVLSNKALTDSQRIEIMRLGGLSRAQAKAKLTQMGLIQSTNTQTNAQNVAVGSTFRLTSAVKGFGTSLKMFVATNKFTLAIMAITTVISGIKSAFESAEQEAEEYIQKQSELISKQEEIISSTESQITSLEELKEKIKDTNGEKEKLLKLSSDIEDVLGKESTKLLNQSNAYDLLNAKIQDNINLRKQEQKEANNKKRQAIRETIENTMVENEGLGEAVTFDELQAYGVEGGKTTQSYFNELVESARKSEGFTNSVEEYAELWRQAIEKAQANMPNTIDLAMQSRYDIFGLSMPSATEIQTALDGQLSNVYSYFEEEINSGRGFLSSERVKQAVKQMWLEGFSFGDISAGLDNLLSTDGITKAWDAYATAVSENSEDKDVLYNDFIAKVDRLKASQPYAENIITDYVNHLYSTLDTSVNKEADSKNYSLLSSIFNSEDFEEHAKKLKELALAGELSPELLTATKEYRQLIDDTGLSAEEAVERIKEFALGESTLSDIISRIQSTSSLLKDVQNDISENGEISFEHIQSISSKLPSLEQEIRDYLNGVEGSQEKLVNKLKECYQEDLKNYDAYYEAKQGNDKVWWHNFLTNSDDLVNELKKDYNIDLSNYSTYLLAKEQIQAMIDDAKSSVSDWSVGIGSIFPDPLSVGGAYHYKAEKLQEYLDKIQKAFKDSINSSTYSTEDYTAGSKDKSSDIDWIETKLNNVDKALDKLNNTIDDTYSNWTDRSKALKDAITDTEKAIGLQGQAYTKYMQKAESIKLPEYLKERVRLGDMSIQNDVNSETKELIDEYSGWYEKAQEAKEAQDELNKSLLELKASDTVDMIEEYYDAIDEAHSNSIESTQAKIDKAETMGFFANGSYYDNIGEELAKQKANLEKKKADLDKVLANSGLDKNSSSYTELQNLIGSISNEIQQLTIDIEDNKNAAQENEWNYFDYLRESVTRLIEEADFFIELMSNEDLFNDKGNFTKYADATLALHNSNYEVYMANAREYAEEMKALEEDIANGIIGGTLAEDRYRELEDARKDAIQSAQDEKNAILDLVENGLQKELDYLNEIIDKKRESLKQEKSLFDYQKSIKEKTQTRDSLRRQLDVYKNDNSEEGLAQAQKLSVELRKAEEDLAETEMEKAMDDVESMLNDISSEYEEWINARLDNEDELLRQIQDKLGENGDINSTLKEISDKYGVSMSDSLKTAIVDGKPFEGVTVAINNLIAKITEYVNGNNVESNVNSDNINVSNGTTTTQPSTTPNTTNDTDTSSQKNYDDIFIHKTYSKNDLDTEHSLVDYLKNKDIQADFQSRAMYWSKIFGGTYTGSASQNRQFMSWLKENGYKNGTFSATKGWHLFDELGLGSEVIITKDGAMRQFNAGDKVINSEGTSNLFTFANDPQGFLEKLGVLNYAIPAVNVKLPDTSMFTRRNTTNGATIGNVNIEVGQVVANDPMEFASQLKQNLANNRTVQKMIQEVGLGGALGHNSMNVKRYL